MKGVTIARPYLARYGIERINLRVSMFRSRTADGCLVAARIELQMVCGYRGFSVGGPQVSVSANP